jgi:hypothetical protein
MRDVQHVIRIRDLARELPAMPEGYEDHAFASCGKNAASVKEQLTPRSTRHPSKKPAP